MLISFRPHYDHKCSDVLTLATLHFNLLSNAYSSKIVNNFTQREKERAKEGRSQVFKLFILEEISKQILTGN